MKKSNMELVVGGSILIALFILIAGVLWLKQVSLAKNRVPYTVLFPNVGTLQLGDPVMVNGVKKGQVKSMYLRGRRVAVNISLDKEIVLTDSCSVTIQNIGLMGERMVGVSLSEAGTPFRHTTRGDTVFIHGYFDSGIAEAMGMMGTVLQSVLDLVGKLETIVHATVGDPEFSARFNTIMVRLDTVVAMAEQLVSESGSDIRHSLRTVRGITTDVQRLIKTNEDGVQAIVEDGAVITARARDITARLDSVALSVRNIIDGIERGEGAIGMMINDEQFYLDLKKSVANLDSLVQEIQEDGLKMRVKFGFGRKK